ncbi:MAG: tetratricopeptide repeat protein, partial [candidate division KSB1 bacterium]|nr:tetratricopeptide repeat protein [candidate division KSB1 bacterium]
QKAKEDSIARAKAEREFLIAFSTGHEHWKNRNYADAVAPLKKAAALDVEKRYPSIYTELADSYLKLEQPDSALITYQEAVTKYPQNAFFYRSAAWLLSAKQQFPEAIDAYLKAIENDGQTTSDYKNVGRLLIAANRNDEALDIYEKLTQLDPNDAEAQEIYASLLAQTGDEDAVIEAKEKALAAKPEDTNLMFSIGRMYFRRGDYQKAVEKFDMLLRLRPEDYEAMEYRGNALQNDGKYTEAIRQYEKILAAKPNHAKVLCDMATCYKELKNYQKAMATVQRAQQINPNYGLAYIVKGEIYEAVADDCISKREKRITNIDDKLVYEKAYNQYQMAARDPQFAELAKRKMNYIQTEIPTKEDKFLFPDVKQPRLDCYTWLP